MTSRSMLLLLLGVLPVTFAQPTDPSRLKRFPILPDMMTHEVGFCYQGHMDFGEDGDKITKAKSGIRVLENGKELGPRAALHADIRNKGKGRYSHWVRQTLYFSASDNSDPRTNGRKYEVVSVNPDSALGGLKEMGGEPMKHVEVITSSAHEYQLALGGVLDMDNTLTRSHGNISVVFQPNLQLTIANTGDTPVRWPKLVANGRRDWSTYDALLEDFTRGAKNDQEKALFIWETMRQNRYHCLPLYPDDEFHDPVRMFNSYGLELCDDMGNCGCSIFKKAGLGKPKYKLDPTVYALYGHVQCEAVVDNQLQFLDVDQDVFYLDRESDHPVSGSAIARDHDLARREVHYGPVFGGWRSAESAASLFGNDDKSGYRAVGGHEMSYTLRPGERAEFRWDNVGKWVAHSKEWDKRPPFYGNSQFVYEPRLAAKQYREGIAGERDIVPATTPGAKLAGGSAKAMLKYQISIPWAICGGAVRAEFAGLAETDRFAIDLTLDGKKLKRVWEGSGKGAVLCEASLDKALETRVAPVAQTYGLIVTLASADARHGANLKSLKITTDIMTAPLSLPRLQVGENTFRYADLQKGPHEVTITHEWQEVKGYRLLQTPPQPTYPPNGKTVRDSKLTFRWPQVAKAGAYHIRVSTRKDFRVPFRPGYDVVINSNTWLIPYTGMFAPDTDYYWRVRVRDKAGAWSDWGPTWSFRWQGPRVPLKVRHELTKQGILLHWQANPRGERPVRYDVYGSDEQGFSVHKSPYTSFVRGTVPANYLGTTADTSLLIGSPKPTHDNMNRAYYRVVAVDANGTESICSDFAEPPHPHIWTAPVTVATVRKPYAYKPQSIRSLGDVQHRYTKPTHSLCNEEKLTFSLAAGPKWLACDAKTGALKGTPDKLGTFPVKLAVKTQLDGQAEQNFTITVGR
jgi:hypothetical protein